MENVKVEGPLTIEHLMPQSWIESWPLADGSKGVSTTQELWDADDDDPLAIATKAAMPLCQTFGNLTILTQELNSSVSMKGLKKPELLRHSLLPYY